MTKNILMLVLFSCFVTVGVVPAEAKPKVYKILGDRKNGSKFRHVEAESYIPFYKTYDELTDYQKKIYGKLYKMLTERPLAETEKPPFPAEGLHAVYRPIIRKNKLVGKNGTVFFVAMIDEEGEAEKVTVYQSPNRVFTDFINTVMFTTKFEPGTCDGVPCKMEFPFEMELRYVNRTKDITGGIQAFEKLDGTE